MELVMENRKLKAGERANKQDEGSSAQTVTTPKEGVSKFFKGFF